MNEIKEIREWLEERKNYEFLYTRTFANVRLITNDVVDFKNAVTLGSKLRTASVWWASVFLRDAYDCSLDPPNTVSNYLESRYIYCKILITAIDIPEAGARIRANDLQKLFFLLLAFNRHEQALWLGGRTYLGDTPERFSGRKDQVHSLREVSEWESLGGDVNGWGSIVAKLRRLIPGQREKECSAGRLDDDPMFPYWEEKPLCGYMLRLWLVMSGQIQPGEAPRGLPDCGVYESLFQNWNDPAALESSLRDACDYHVRRSTEHRHGDIPEFSERPYNLIPFEILAYGNVRKRLGLETPFPAHPLLDSPFVRNLPEELPPSDDPLLLEVLAAVRKVLAVV